MSELRYGAGETMNDRIKTVMTLKNDVEKAVSLMLQAEKYSRNPRIKISGLRQFCYANPAVL